MFKKSFPTSFIKIVLISSNTLTHPACNTLHHFYIASLKRDDVITRGAHSGGFVGFKVDSSVGDVLLFSGLMWLDCAADRICVFLMEEDTAVVMIVLLCWLS